MDRGQNRSHDSELVVVKGCTIRQEEPRVLTVEEFQALLAAVSKEPFRTMLLFDMCLGLRFSKLIAVQWQDFDGKNLKVRIRRGVVRQVADDVKTRHSRKPVPLDPHWRRSCRYGKTEFNKPQDWVWASPAAAGEHPYCYTTLYEMITEAATRTKLDGVTWRTLRHSYRSWLDETGAPITVQQNLMRHSDIRTTMNIYGDALPATLRAANSRVARMALPN